MEKREREVLARVGTFVIVGFVLFGALVFLLGGERGLFARYVEYTSSFTSIEGLKAGAPVRLAGVEIGQVTGVSFYDDPADQRLKVHMKLMARYADRIRGDSKASIGSRGLLGDKVVDISIGSPSYPQLPPGSELAAAPAADYTEMLKKGSQVLENTVAITTDIRELIAAYNTPEFKEDVTGLIGSTREIVEQVKGGEGALHALIYDRKTGEDVRTLVANAAAAARRADDAIARVDRILADVRSGSGLVGAMLYDPEGKQAVAHLSRLADELGTLATAIRTQEGGLAHQLVYGGPAGQPQLGEELASAARELREIVSRVNAGDGSLGALINDPTIYEDLKGILGNVKRNRILRSLVRYSISQSDQIEAFGQKE